MTKLKNLKCDNSKTKNVTTQNSKCDKTQNVTKLKKFKCDNTKNQNVTKLGKIKM